MTNSVSSEDDDGRESRDSVLVEFTDVNIDFTPRPIREEVLRHLPSWLHEAAVRHTPTTKPKEPQS